MRERGAIWTLITRADSSRELNERKKRIRSLKSADSICNEFDLWPHRQKFVLTECHREHFFFY